MTTNITGFSVNYIKRTLGAAANGNWMKETPLYTIGTNGVVVEWGGVGFTRDSGTSRS